MECHACGETISEKAADCPYCGTSVSSPAGSGAESGRAGAGGDTGDAPGGDTESGRDGGRDDGDAGGERSPGRQGRETAERDADGPAAGRTGEGTTGGRTTDGSDGRPGDSPERGWEQRPVSSDPEGEHRETDAAESDDTPADSERPGASGTTASDDPAAESPDGASPETDGWEAAGATGRDTVADNEAASEGPAGGQGVTIEEPAGGLSGTDPGELVARLPLFPGAAAGFAVAVVTFGVAVTLAAVIPGGRDTFALGATVLFDFHFGTGGHVTPAVFDIFEEFSPPQSVLGLFYLLPMGLLYTAGKAVVAFNTDETATLPESTVGGATVALGYLPVLLVAFVLAPSAGSSVVSLVGVFVLAAVVYPVAFGGLGGLFAGGLSGGERRVSTVYALGTLFVVLLGTFLSTFLFLGAATDVDLLSRALVTLFAMAGTTAFTLGGGSAANVVPFVVTAGAFGVAGFVRSWRSAPGSPVRGFAKGASMAVTYAVVAGVFGSALPVLADDYLQEQLELGLVATTFVEGVVSTGFATIPQYVTAVLGATVVYVVVVGGTGGAVAGAIRSDGSGSATETGAGDA